MGSTPARREARIGSAVAGVGLLLNPWLLGLLTHDGTIDDVVVFAAAVGLSSALLLAGLQLGFRWVERISFGRPMTPRRTPLTIAGVALAVAATSWRVATYTGGHDHTTVVPVEQQTPTSAQAAWAQDFRRRSREVAARRGWFDIDRALASGFQKDPINHNHYPNTQYMFDDVILDPERPEWLVYDQGPDGKVLMAFMFFTRRLDEKGPTPGGPLAQWHYHPYEEVRCAINGLWTVAKADVNGACAQGIPVTRTPEMFHVWFIDHPLGHFTEMKMVPEFGAEPLFDRGRLHPIAVHFAIALFLVAVLIDGVAFARRRPDYHETAWTNLGLAAVAAIAAVATGMTAEIELKPTHATHATLDIHKLLAFSSLAVIVVLAGWRYALRGQFPARAAVLYIALSLAGVGLIGGTGFYGGELVYEHGAGVRALDYFARERYWDEVRAMRNQQPLSDHSGHR